ncbi:MAG: SpoIVB peptidase [Clostridia bacterium]|nr:SpoIVB peptidase [Clostridia bacterium]
MKQIRKRGYIKCIGWILCVFLLCFNSGEKMTYIRELSSNITLEQLEELRQNTGGLLSLEEKDIRQVSGDMSETLGKNNISVRMMGIPIKQVSYDAKEDIRLMPGGMPIGVSLYSDGVLVVGLGSINKNADICPAAEGGIKAGDVIVKVNGKTVEDSFHLSELCSEGGDLNFTVRRDDSTIECTVTPVYDEESGGYLAGMWVRDSTSGIGTLSYWDMTAKRFGALGHPITDIDTGAIIDVKNGNIIKSSIIGISAGSSGKPGEVIGSFSVHDEKWGEIDKNCEYGVYGDAINMPVNPLYPEGMSICWWDEVHTGAAEILCTVTDEGIKEYDCEIIKLFPAEGSGSKGIVLKITSEELISITGGIVQGMSGSPIIQDGKLVGAVTHVLVNDPTRGYGIFIENMLKAVE